MVTEAVHTRVSDGNTLRALVNRVPMAANRTSCGVVNGPTISGRNPSNTTNRTEFIASLPRKTSYPHDNPSDTGRPAARLSA